MRILSAIVLFGVFAVVAACGGGGDIAGDGGTNGGMQNDDPVDPLAGLDPVVADASYTNLENLTSAPARLLSYRMPGVNGGVVTANAVVLTPQSQVPADGFPVIVWGHGTTGVADSCAPSAGADLAAYIPYLNQYLENGYAIVAPDYEGLGSESDHPYLHLASAGRSMNYAVSAAVKQYPELSNRYAVIGHSQGGHAALGAAEYSAEVASVVLTGVVAIAPAANIRLLNDKLTEIVIDGSRSIADRVEAATIQLMYSALLLNAVSIVEPGFDLDSVYGGNGNVLKANVETKCLRDIRDELLGTVTGALFISGDVDSIIASDSADRAEVAAFLAANEPGTTNISAPVLLQQGLQDETILAESTTALHNRLMQHNTNSTIVEFPTANHGSVVYIGAESALNFLVNLF